MRTTILSLIFCILFNGCATQKDSVTPKIPKPAVEFSSIDK